MAERRKGRKKKEPELKEEDPKPTKEEYAVAKYLRQKLPEKKTTLLGHKVDYFIASKAIDCLLDSPWATNKEKSEVLFTTRESVVGFMDRMLQHKFFHRARKIVVQKDVKKKKKDDENKKKDKDSEVSKKKEKESEEIKKKEKEPEEARKKEKETDDEKKKETKDKKEEKKENEDVAESKKEKDSKKAKTKGENDGKMEDKDGDSGEKKKEKKKIKLDMHMEQIFVDSNEHIAALYKAAFAVNYLFDLFNIMVVYINAIACWILFSVDPYVWIYDPIPMRTWITGTLMVVAAVLICLFPLWPKTIRHYIYYLSIAAAGFLVFIIGLAAIRLVVFVVIWIATLGKHHLWLLPNLTEDVGFFESFWPLYNYEYKGNKNKDTKAKKKDSKEKESSENKDQGKSDSSTDQETKAEGQAHSESEQESEGDKNKADNGENGFEIVQVEDLGPESSECK